MIESFFKQACIVGLVTFSLVSSVWAQQAVVADQSTIGFITKQMGSAVDGKFGKFDAQIQFDPKKPEASKISFTIDTNSAVIADAETTKEVKKADWFNTAKFPTATFAATSVKGLGAGKFEVAGNLTIKGVTKSVVVPVTATQKGTATTVDGVVAIKRLDFKLGDGEWKDTSIVADEVQIKFKLALTGVASL
jgi:polyisoprenoid-binding protein YceI